MPKVTLEEAMDEVDRNMFYAKKDNNFERYCGACDKFDTEFCPFQYSVFADTNSEQMRCGKFEG